MSVALLRKEQPCELTEYTQESLRTLTPAERQILLFIVNGQTEKEIAEERCIAVETARTHTRNILRKLGVRTRTAAAVLAVAIGGFTPQLGVLLREN